MGVGNSGNIEIPTAAQQKEAIEYLEGEVGGTGPRALANEMFTKNRTLVDFMKFRQRQLGHKLNDAERAQCLSDWNDGTNFKK